jgi:uncharacterized protein YndB with AHSA1/START domain
MTEANSSTFVYVTFIRTTTDKLWSALTDPVMMRDYWFGMHQESDWLPGSSWRLVNDDGEVKDAGEILECEPGKRLVIKWRNEFRPDIQAEGYGRCCIEIESLQDAAKLTITHSIEQPNSKLIEHVSSGWPRIISNLKSLIETGQTILT